MYRFHPNRGSDHLANHTGAHHIGANPIAIGFAAHPHHPGVVHVLTRHLSLALSGADTAAAGARPVIRGSIAVPPSLWRPVPLADAYAPATTFMLDLDGHPEWFDDVNGNPFNPFAIRLGWPGNESILPPYGGCCRLGWSLGQVFQHGQLLDEVPPATVNASHPLPPASWTSLDNGSAILVRFGGPGPAAAEITVRKNVFAPRVRGLGWITVRGFVLEHAATQWDDEFWIPRTQPHNPSNAAFAQGGMLSPRSGHSWVVENNTLRHSKTIAMDIGDEGGYDAEGEQPTPYFVGNHTIRRNRLVNNGGKGITGSFGSIRGPEPLSRGVGGERGGGRASNVGEHAGGASGVASMRGSEQPCPGCSVHRNHGGRILYNIISGNNYLSCHASENAALKTHGFSGEMIGNLIIDNYQSVGVWFDDLWYDVRFSRNIIVGRRDNDWGGLMLEISTGPALIVRPGRRCLVPTCPPALNPHSPPPFPSGVLLR